MAIAHDRKRTYPHQQLSHDKHEQGAALCRCDHIIDHGLETGCRVQLNIVVGCGGNSVFNFKAVRYCISGVIEAGMLKEVITANELKNVDKKVIEGKIFMNSQFVTGGHGFCILPSLRFIDFRKWVEGQLYSYAFAIVVSTGPPCIVTRST